MNMSQLGISIEKHSFEERNLHALLICKRGPRSLPTKRAFRHFETMLIAPIVSPLSLNGRKAKFYNSRLGICQFRSKATEVGGERLQPHS